MLEILEFPACLKHNFYANKIFFRKVRRFNEHFDYIFLHDRNRFIMLLEEIKQDL